MNLSFIIRSTIGEEVETLPCVPAHIYYEKLPGTQSAFVYGPWGHIILQLITLNNVDLWDTQYLILSRMTRIKTD